MLLTRALVLLLGLVAFSSRSGFNSSGAPAVSNTYISYAMSVFLIMFVLMIPVAIYSYAIRTKEIGAEGRAPSKRVWRTLIALGGIAILLYVRHYLQAHGGLFGHGGLFHHSGHATPN